MSIAVAPSATYEAVLNWGVSGLTGTLGVRLLNNAGGTTQARVTAGIGEFPAGSGIYYVSKTAPGTRGQYTLLWDDGATTPGHIATEDLLVTSTYPDIVTSGSLYVTREQIKASQQITGTIYDNDIDLAVEAASRGIDNVTGRKFYPSTETRYYSPDRWTDQIVEDDIISVTSVGIDTDGNGTYDEAWVENTDYYLDPPNAVNDDRPYTSLVLRSVAGRTFPSYQRSVQIVGVFGWPAVPAGVAQYAKILATKLMKRDRDSPFGFVSGTAADGSTVAHIIRRDPDFDLLVGPYVQQKLFV